MSDRKPRSISERRRAFLALQGERLPLIGERGKWSGPGPENRWPRAVEVVRVSASGRTIWTRFVTAESRRRYGSNTHRWWFFGRSPQRMAYCSFGNDLYGTVLFEEQGQR